MPKQISVTLTPKQIQALRCMLRITYVAAVLEQMGSVTSFGLVSAAHRLISATDNMRFVDQALNQCLAAGQKAGVDLIPVNILENVHDLMRKLVASQYGDSQFIILEISGEDPAAARALVESEVEGLRFAFQSHDLEQKAVKDEYAFAMAMPPLKQ